MDMTKVKAALAAISAKLKEPMTHFFLSAALLAVSAKVPDAYDIYFYGACAVLALLGFSLPGPLRKQVGALLDAHQQVTEVTIEVAKEAGVDTTALEAAAAHPALQAAKSERAPPGIP